MRQVGLAAGIVRKLQMIRNADDISIKQEDKSVQCVCTNLLSSHLLLYNSWDMDTERTQAEIEGIQNVSLKKDPWGHVTRQSGMWT